MSRAHAAKISCGTVMGPTQMPEFPKNHHGMGLYRMKAKQVFAYLLPLTLIFGESALAAPQAKIEDCGWLVPSGNALVDQPDALLKPSDPAPLAKAKAPPLAKAAYCERDTMMSYVGDERVVKLGLPLAIRSGGREGVLELDPTVLFNYHRVGEQYLPGKLVDEMHTEEWVSVWTPPKPADGGMESSVDPKSVETTPNYRRAKWRMARWVSESYLKEHPLAAEPVGVSYIIVLSTFDCTKELMRDEQSTTYFANGTTKAGEAKPGPWGKTVGATRAVLDFVCKATL
jgi:hypothetical protein